MAPELDLVHMRQMELIDPAKLGDPLAVIGAGNIGSWTTLALAKMGCSDLTVFDSDLVEEHNCGSQLYGHSLLGKEKPVALNNIVSFLVATVNIKMERNWEENTDLSSFELIILALDSIATRLRVFSQLKGQNKILIDGRMAGNAIEIYTIRLDDPDALTAYEKTFFPEEEARAIPCSRQSVVYNCLVISGVITDLVAKIANGEPYPRRIDIDLKNLFLFRK